MHYRETDGSRSTLATSIPDRYKNGLAELKREYDENPSGLRLAQQRSGFMDTILTAVFNEALATSGINVPHGLQGIAAVALGGYGRRDLCPFSDIDLMVLHRLKNKALVERVAENFFYPLWDLGLVIGHGTRTVKESLAMASANFELQTSFLEARLIVGDAKLFHKFQEGIIKQLLSKGGTRFLKNILTESDHRHRQYGQAAFLLEPDLKEGEGGLRDIHAIQWAAKGLLGATSPNDLVRNGYLTSFDVESLQRSHEFMLQVRNHLHYIADRKTDRLFFEYQEEISRTLGFKGGDGTRGVEKFMRSFYTHASTIEQVSMNFWEQLKEKFLPVKKLVDISNTGTTEDGIALINGKVSLISPDAISRYPGSEIRLFKRSLEHGAAIDYQKIGRIRDGLSGNNTPAPWTEEIRSDFIDILSAGEAALPALKAMSHLGLLAHYIPEWTRVACLPQHDSYHLYTVDMHLFLTVAELQKIGAGGYNKNNPLLRQMYAQVERVDLLLIAGLLHDIGKGSGKGHSKRGAKLVREICSRMGLPSRDSKTVSYLVENHLLLVDTAMRRDLNDENMIIDLAASIVDKERLTMLYLLSIADSLATGPKAWDTWKDNLLRELFSKAIHIIDSGEYTSKKSIERMRKTASSVKSALLDHYSEEEVDLFLKQMPHSYLLAQSSENIVEHFGYMKTNTGGISINAKPKDGVYELTLVAKDHPGLFSKVSGALALHGLNILGAQVYTQSDGTALDIFNVEGYFEHGIIEDNEDKWEKVERDIKRALEGRISLEYRIAEKAKRYQGNNVLRKPPEVEVDNTSSDFYTIIEVHAEDRIGLLYSITRVMHDLNVDIHLAKVSTNVDKVIDVFYVWDIEGQKLYDEEQVNDIKKAIRMALEQ